MANIHIENSSLMNRNEFQKALADYPVRSDYKSSEQYTLALKDAIKVKRNRSYSSLISEWAAHKLLYSMNIKRSSTISVDLNYPQKWYMQLGYFIVGGIARIFY